MSKRWKKAKPAGQNAAGNTRASEPSAVVMPALPPMATTQANSPPEPPAATVWTLGDWVGLVGGLIGIASLVISVLSWHEARQSRKVAEDSFAVSQKSYDRAAGKIAAKIVIKEALPTYKDVPERLKPKSQIADLLGTIRVGSLSDLRQLDPRAVLHNAGDEIVDAIRIETKAPLVSFHYPENPKERQFAALRPWVLKPPDRDEPPLTRNLRKGDEIAVTLARPLVSQLLAAQANAPPGKDCIGRFEVRAFGRVVGATSFDGDESTATLVLGFIWDPKGFPEDECKRYLEGNAVRAEIRMDR